jgi:hypothetical protein
MTRRVLNVLTALSLLLCMAVCVLWVLSKGVVVWASAVGPEAAFNAWSSHGCCVLQRADVPLEMGPSHYRLHGGAENAQVWAAMVPQPYGMLFWEWTGLIRAVTRVPWHEGPASASPGFGAGFTTYQASARTLWVPYWLLAATTAWLPGRRAVKAWRTRRRIRRLRAGLCPGCGYDVRATPGQCPECGESSAGLAVSAGEKTA